MFCSKGCGLLRYVQGMTSSTRPLLLISNGHAEDLIGAALVRELRRIRPELRVLALPLVAQGAAYAGLAELAGPLLDLPSGGFPFGSAENLRADLEAGLLSTSAAQWAAAWRQGPYAAQVVVVGDTYALAVGALAAKHLTRDDPSKSGPKLPLTHLQPLVSVYYTESMTPAAHLRELNALGANLFMPWELALGRRARRVYTRDSPTARFLARRGVSASYRGSFAMDILPAPERDLTPLTGKKPVLALLPGQRGDASTSLPVMLAAARLLPEYQAVVAWPRPFSEWPAGELRVLDDQTAWTDEVLVLRGAFSATLHAARVALGTAGTANEQAAGLGVPVVGFPTAGPQYVTGFATRQARLLGAGLTLSAPEPQTVAAAARQLAKDSPRRALAVREGTERIGRAGALGAIAAELLG